MTRLMVLGLLLEHGQMSGYEMQQAMQSAQTDTWAGVFPASIYHALRKMNDEGLVELKNMEHTGNRSKAIYSITSDGREEFDRLLLTSFQQSSVELPTTLYTALTFYAAGQTSTDEIHRALDEQKQSIASMMDMMKAGQAAKAEFMEIPPHVMLIFSNIYAQYALQLKFIEDIRHALLQGNQT
ncbi:PadR family transcriptional regulator [Paenibacillus profundus]|uniref:PadR family transcriptional regulator n=1 Tax=Paenibacillus profundus TaxID=1173085 RepID=A0ABS8YKH8_9BACL|nr:MULTISPECIES: PadR family transcriptional regulator [Paenibacillus]MCE5172383.1 PadR family transcriptional regulator [Paenibacillus profundus]